MSVVLRELAGDPDAARLIDVLAPGIHASGNPYFDWLFGDPDVALGVIKRCMARDSSEIAIRRVTVLERDGELLGCFIAVDGAEMARCARSDSVTALAAVGRAGRTAFLRRAAAAASLRRPIDADQWFWSKMWVDPKHRGAGLGRLIAEQVAADGDRRGFPRGRVDARPEDAHLIALYESVGYEQRGLTRTSDGIIGVIEMVREP